MATATERGIDTVASVVFTHQVGGGFVATAQVGVGDFPRYGFGDGVTALEAVLEAMADGVQNWRDSSFYWTHDHQGRFGMCKVCGSAV